MKFFRIAFIIGFVFSCALWASVGKVSLLKGEAYAKRDAQTIMLYTGFFLETNDAIITGKESQVQLLFDDKTVITLGGESDFKIEEYLNDAQNPKAKFKFNQGTFKTITGNIGKTSPENFKMETKTATIGIRGTISGGTVPPPPPRDTSPLPELFFCFSGVITITPLSPPNETIDVPAGHMVILPFDAPPSYLVLSRGKS